MWSSKHQVNTCILQVLKDENVQDEERAKSNSLRAVLEERQMDSSVLICKIFLVDLCFSVSVLK